MLGSAAKLLILIATTCVTHTAVAEDVISGKFDLVDHTGQSVTERSFDGKLRLVFFGFTQCPDVCPTTLLEVRRALHLLGDDGNEVQPLFISIDPANDTQERLAAYVAAFHPSMKGLRGSDEQTEAVAKAFNVTYGVTAAAVATSGQEEIFHTSYLFLMGRQGEFVDVFGYGTRASIIAEVIRAHLQDELSE
ncbi:MAG: SCO family protein [Woeseiaceae bacterium]